MEEESGLKLQCLWKLRDFKCGVELINRIYVAVEPTGHFPSLHLEQPNQVRAELWTSSMGTTVIVSIFRWVNVIIVNILYYSGRKMRNVV